MLAPTDLKNACWRGSEGGIRKPFKKKEDEASKKRKAPEERTVRCARCRTTRTIQGKPCAGWDCSDGGYTCKQRYECKHCNRSFYREGDPSDDLECKDFDKECLPIKKKK